MPHAHKVQGHVQGWRQSQHFRPALSSSSSQRGALLRYEKACAPEAGKLHLKLVGALAEVLIDDCSCAPEHVANGILCGADALTHGTCGVHQHEDACLCLHLWALRTVPPLQSVALTVSLLSMCVCVYARVSAECLVS